ncbi:MAG: plasma-membrane proton-efflux P-type ATPase [Thaumarchaeota archaeon]|nr:plasma-membrane proton-efflux P-type ATPase [Nitrososphaerota archaeon]
MQLEQIEKRQTEQFRNLSVEEATSALLSSQAGLTDAEAKSRADRLGYNEVRERERSPVVEFALRLWGPVAWLLEITIGLSIVIGHYVESAIILLLLLLNAMIGFQRTRSSQRSLLLLKRRLALKARILRDGTWSVRASREVVPGDVISIALGDLVPADAKIIRGTVSVDQSALTGESLPVSVGESGILYSSSLVQRGDAVALVLNIGDNTMFGKTAELVKTARPKSHQEELMLSLVKYSMYFGVVLLLIVLADAIIVHSSLLTTLTFSLIFLIAAVPAAMPAVFSIVLSVGATELADKGVLVTRLDSIEDAASLEVLCLDKTGTITQNKLAVVDPVACQGFAREDVVRMAALASSEEFKDMIDLAVIRYAEAINAKTEDYRRISFIPFDPSTKKSEAIIESIEGHRLKVVKGAPQVVMALPGERRWSSEYEKALEEFSSRGFRVLAVAVSEADSLDNFQPAGLLPISDPPRPDSKTMIDELKNLGVRPKMLTGDNLAIARQVGREIGIGEKIYRMSEVSKLGEDAEATVVLEGDGFAEVFPEDKYKIVRLLQSRGLLVGMTGDGVNDAPALKQAELGIAVQNSTDAARASSSVVLTESGIGVLNDCIKESRRIYQRLLTWVLNRLTRTVQFLGLLAIGFLWLHTNLLTVLDMVILVFVGDFLAMSLATDNVTYTRGKPNLWNVRKVTIASILIGILLLVEALIGVSIGVSYFHLRFLELQTYVMLMLLFMSQFRVLTVRERRRFWSSSPGRDLTLTVVAATVSFVIIGLFGVIVPALSFYPVLFLLVYSAASTLVIDFPKYSVFKWLAL